MKRETKKLVNNYFKALDKLREHLIDLPNGWDSPCDCKGKRKDGTIIRLIDSANEQGDYCLNCGGYIL